MMLGGVDDDIESCCVSSMNVGQMVLQHRTHRDDTFGTGELDGAYASVRFDCVVFYFDCHIVSSSCSVSKRRAIFVFEFFSSDRTLRCGPYIYIPDRAHMVAAM